MQELWIPFRCALRKGVCRLSMFCTGGFFGDFCTSGFFGDLFFGASCFPNPAPSAPVASSAPSSSATPACSLLHADIDMFIGA